MIKCLPIAVLLCAAGWCCAVAGEEPRPSRERPSNAFMTEDGKIDLAKVEASSLPNARKTIFKKADKDGDGFLNAEEMKTVLGRRGTRSESAPKGDNQRQPGQNEFNPSAPKGNREPARGATPSFMRDIMTDDGKIDLAKLEKSRMSAEQKQHFQKADKNKDGFVDREEMRDIMRNSARPEGFGESGRFLFMRSVMTEDGRVDLGKLNKADKNGDGFLDREELKALVPQGGPFSDHAPKGSTKRFERPGQADQGERSPRRGSNRKSDD